MLWFFGPEACGILAPQPGIKHVLLRLEGEILPTGSPGKSQLFIFFQLKYLQCCVRFSYIAEWISYVGVCIHFFRVFSTIGYYKMLNIVVWALQ